jgi:pyruvate formate lyase activating enzyme
MVTAYKIAKKAGLEHAYIGNMHHPDYMDTYCPSCKTKVIGRASMFFAKNKLKKGKCPKCGHQVLKHF